MIMRTNERLIDGLATRKSFIHNLYNKFIFLVVFRQTLLIDPFDPPVRFFGHRRISDVPDLEGIVIRKTELQKIAKFLLTPDRAMDQSALDVVEENGARPENGVGIDQLRLLGLH